MAWRGLRVGWGYAPLEMISAMERIRAPFNVNLPAQAAAVAALGDKDFQAQSRALVLQWRPWLTQQLGGLGLDMLPSQGNFVLVGFPDARQDGAGGGGASGVARRPGAGPRPTMACRITCG